MHDFEITFRALLLTKKEISYGSYQIPNPNGGTTWVSNTVTVEKSIWNDAEHEQLKNRLKQILQLN